MLPIWLLLAAAPPADLTLVGVLISPTASRSQALVVAAGRTRIAAVGESAFGGRVTAIGQSGVSLDFEGRTVELRLPGVAPAPAATAMAAAEPPVQTFARRDVESRLGTEIPRILAETAIAPVMEDGRVTGVELRRVPDASLLSDAGLRAGDVIREINGTPIDGMATLIGLWPRLRNESELRAVVMRGGQSLTLSLRLK